MGPLVSSLRVRVLILVLFLGLMFIFDGMVFATHPAGLSITLAGTSDFFVDSNGFCNSTSGPDGMWLPVVITNISGTETYDGLQVTLTPPTNTVADDPVRFIGDLAPGESAEVFFFIDYRALRTLPACNNGTDGWYSSSYSVTVTSVVPGGLTSPAVFNDTFTNLNMISAAAGGALLSDFIGPGAAVGQIFEQTITYDYGNNPAGSDLFLQPTGNGDFNDQCYRLVGSEVIASDVPGVTVGATDQLFFTGTDTENGDTTQVEFRWQVLCTPGAATQTFPWTEITSGTQFKYDEGGFQPTTFPLPNPVNNQVTITKTANPTILPTGGVVTYTITFNNAYTQPLYVDRITDVLPSGVSFIDETGVSAVQTANSAASPSNGATGTLDWYGIPVPTANKTYVIPAGGSMSLIYTANVQNVLGTYTNSVTATIGSTTIGPATSNVVVGFPDLTIDKAHATDPFVRGSTGTYTVTVGNTGTGATSGTVIVSDTLPTGLTLSATPTGTGWTCTGNAGDSSFSCNRTDALAAGSSYPAITVVVNVGQGTANAVTNSATASGGGDSTPANDNDLTNIASTADLSISKSDGSATYTPGGILTYTMTVSNAGPSDVTGATVADTFPAVLSNIVWTCAGTGSATCTANGTGDINDTVDIPSGESVTYTVNADISAAATGNLVNTATVTVPVGTSDPNSANNASTDTDTASPSADLSISKSDGSTTYTPGGTLTYTMTVSNAGPSDVTGATVADTFPAVLSNIVWTCAGTGSATCTANGTGDINDTVDIPSGESVTYTVNADISAAATGNLVNTATVTVPVGTSDPNSANNASTDTDIDSTSPQADLSISKSDGSTTYTPGGILTYTMTVSNAGPSDVTGATVADTFPAVLSNIVWTCAGTGSATCTANGTGDINDTVDIPSGESVTYTVNADISAAATGNLVNTATVTVPVGTSDPNSANNASTDTDTPVTPTVNASKSAALQNDVNGNGQLDPGDMIGYTITISNTGSGDATTVTFTDTPDVNTVLVVGSVTTTQGSVTTGNGAGDTFVAVNVGALAAGTSVTITFAVTVDNPLPGGVTQVSNQGTVSGSNIQNVQTDDPSTGTTGDTTTTPISQPLVVVPTATPQTQVAASSPSNLLFFDPSISKIGFLQHGDLGLQNEQIEWFVSVLNTGNATGTNVVITDTLRPELHIDAVNVTAPVTATINGQTVIVTIPSLALGQVVRFSILTTVISGGAVVENTACLRADNFGSERCVTALAVGSLPRTGETPAWRGLFIGLIGFVVLLASIQIGRRPCTSDSD